MRRFAGLLPLTALAIVACSSTGGERPPSDAGPLNDGASPVQDSSLPPPFDASSDRTLPPDLDALPPKGAFCALPGSVVFTDQGPQVVPGATVATPSLDWLTLPVGFCAHYFAHVPTARQLRFAPDGHLFVASPTTPTTGGAGNGVAGIVVVPDDNADGVADKSVTYLGSLPSVQGLAFYNGYLYFQDGLNIRKVAYNSGDLAPSSSATVFATFGGNPALQSNVHWTKVFDVAQDGTFYVTNGGDQSETCQQNQPLYGAIFSVAPNGTLTTVATGFRNPIAMRCEKDHDVCLAAELSLDYSATQGGREKILPVRQGDNWGFPCCATQGVPYSGMTYSGTMTTPDCSGVANESDSFLIGHTPFGIDFETGKWPAPWGNRAFVSLHGVFGSWQGARVVGIALDPNTGLPLPASDIDGGESANSNMTDFAIGWDDGQQDHGRPAAVTFAPDGRLFIGDDNQGTILWIAPVDLKP